jgi:hypothetical protein
MKRKLILSLAFAFAVVGFSPAVGATRPDQNGEHKVTICHRDNNVKKPYGPGPIEVDESAVDGVGSADHYGKHQGPLASSEAVAQQLKDSHTKWGDIIPPVDPYHSGLNWTTEGQAIYNNDCQYVEPEEPEEPETPVTPETPRTPVTPTSTDVDEEAPQVEAPAAGGVNAGSGDTATIATAAVALIGSLATLGYGIVRFTKFGA